MSDIGELGRFLRGWRIKKGHSLRSLADALGVSYTLVGKWERREKRVPMDRIYDLADVLGVEVADLFRDPQSETDPLEDRVRRAPEEVRAAIERILDIARVDNPGKK